MRIDFLTKNITKQIKTKQNKAKEEEKKSIKKNVDRSESVLGFNLNIQ